MTKNYKHFWGITFSLSAISSCFAKMKKDIIILTSVLMMASFGLLVLLQSMTAMCLLMQELQIQSQKTILQRNRNICSNKTTTAQNASQLFIFFKASIIELNKFALPSKHFPLNNTLCSSLNCFISSFDEKLISLETALHFKIFFGTLATKMKTVNNQNSKSPFGIENFDSGHTYTTIFNKYVIPQEYFGCFCFQKSNLTFRKQTNREHFILTLMFNFW